MNTPRPDAAGPRPRGPQPSATPKNSTQMRDDIEQTRSSLDQTIDALTAKLRPSNLAREAASTVINDSGLVARGIFETAKRNPIPAALVGAGLAFLLLKDSDAVDPVRRLWDKVTGHSDEDHDESRQLGPTGLSDNVRRRPLRSPNLAAGSGTFTGSKAKAFRYEPVQEHELDSIDTLYPEYRRLHETEKHAAGFAHDDESDEAQQSRGRLAAARKKAADASHSALERAQQVGGSVADTVKRAVARARDLAGQAGDHLGDAAHHVGDAAQHAVGAAQHAVGDAAHHAADYAGSATHAAASGTASAAAGTWHAATATAAGVRGAATAGLATLADSLCQTGRYVNQTSSQLTDGATQTMKETATRVREGAENRPLGMAVAALAAGVVAGMIIPTTRKENQWFGQQADHLKDMASDAVTHAKDQAKEAASAALESGRDQGLNPTDLKDKAAHVAAAAKDAALHAASDTAQDEGLTPQQLKDKAATAADEARQHVKQNA